ncbi:Retrovirus-related Pol polyprotein [Arachis hypogaea]|nr:Retrovirus-related Pol polyprotein [Arachis hypogaea]
MEQMSESEFESQLLTQEKLIERFRQTDLGPVQANVAQSEDVQECMQGRGYNNYIGGFRAARGRGYFMGTRRSLWWQSSRPQCQLCEKIEMKPQSPSTVNPQALLALPSVIPNTAWYPDSGTSSHITFDQKNLITGSDYDGTEQVYGDNGQCMKIE